MNFKFLALLKREQNQSGKDPAGYFLIEAVVVILLFAIVGLTFANSAVFGMKMRHRAAHRAVAAQVAADLIEEKKLTDPAALAAGTTTDTYTWPYNTRMTFQRVQTVTENSDGTRTVTVQVTDLSKTVGNTIQLTTTISPWGSQ